MTMRPTHAVGSTITALCELHGAVCAWGNIAPRRSAFLSSVGAVGPVGGLCYAMPCDHVVSADHRNAAQDRVARGAYACLEGIAAGAVPEDLVRCRRRLGLRCVVPRSHGATQISTESGAEARRASDLCRRLVLVAVEASAGGELLQARRDGGHDVAQGLRQEVLRRTRPARDRRGRVLLGLDERRAHLRHHRRGRDLGNLCFGDLCFGRRLQ
mmetsp:Transcript_46101/g.121447  ORF Transcript_46101/g.121447 Transcript_46101/m.121447 type:complete len:213 (-) Transcript_46101:379-1017(-)